MFVFMLIVCFRLEKGVMAFGWGRWDEVQSHAQLRKGWSHTDIEVIIRLYNSLPWFNWVPVRYLLRILTWVYLGSNPLRPLWSHGEDVWMVCRPLRMSFRRPDIMRGLLSAWYACIGAWNSAHSVLPSRGLAVSSSHLSLSDCRSVSCIHALILAWPNCQVLTYPWYLVPLACVSFALVLNWFMFASIYRIGFPLPGRLRTVSI